MRHLLPILSIFLVGLLALAATLGAALLAREGQARVAMVATSAAWARVEALGLPIVRLAAGGILIVIDGTGSPDALARLRAGSSLLLDASLVPGCDAGVEVPLTSLDSEARS